MKRVNDWLLEIPALTGLLAFLCVTGSILIVKVLGNRQADWQDVLGGCFFGLAIWAPTVSRRRRSRRYADLL